ncbi:MAG: hypothetical protein K6B41_00445 [Butyrivibrio sp.]|nr:hypothetical protein [Butyrivibrio sp.]
MNNRESLITGLAVAMGQGEALKTRYDKNKYDASTGTILCNGHIIKSQTIEQARMFFDEQRKKYQAQIDNLQGAYDIMCFYETAVQAIEMMQEQSLVHGGKVEIKSRRIS